MKIKITDPKRVKHKASSAQKMALQGLLRELCLGAGIPTAEGTIETRTAALAGRSLNKVEAYNWLANEFERRGQIMPDEPPRKGRKTRPAPSTRPRLPAAVFYASDEWRRLRFRALKASNGACELCGRSKRLHGVVLHVDHVKPRSKFPELELVLSNLQILCEDCNLGKSNTDDTDWRKLTAGDENVVRLDAIDWRTF